MLDTSPITTSATTALPSPACLGEPINDEQVARLQSRLTHERATVTARYVPASPAPEDHRDACWRFLSECVWTWDQIQGTKRRFPAEKEYLYLLLDRWCRHRLLLIPKSRRMVVTWTFCAIHYWLARFGHPGSKIAFVSRKEGRSEAEGSAELVWRCKFIHEHLPKNVMECPIEYTFARLQFPAVRSEIIGVGQGADQLRQHTLSAILADELAFWEHAQETYIASRPTIEGGGRFTGVSSAHPGFFKELVFDTV